MNLLKPILIALTISFFCWAAEKREISANGVAKAPTVWKPQIARWIWLEGQEKPGNAYVQFRKSFNLNAEPNQATVHVSADCRYVLYVNGQFAGRGPVTSNPKYKQVDVYDVRHLLEKGENVISSLVLQRHNKTSRLWPVRGGFILQLDTDLMSLGTDDSWRARWAIEYKSDTPYMTHQYGQQEWVDGRLIPVGWQKSEFNDSCWLGALEVEAADKYWPAELELRTVPYMIREVIYPKKLVSFFGISSQWSPRAKDPANQIEVDYVLPSVLVRYPENIAEPSKGPVIFQENLGDGIGFVVDLGEGMLGYPFIELECTAGITVDSVVLGKHTGNFDVEDYPFSHLEARPDGKANFVPGLHLTTVGVVRDSAKWPKRDRRKCKLKRDVIDFDVFSPYTVGKMLKANKELKYLQETTDRCIEEVSIGGAMIKRPIIRSSQKYYRTGIELYLLEKVIEKLEQNANTKDSIEKIFTCEQGAVFSENWVDIAGQLMGKNRLDKLQNKIESREIESIEKFHNEITNIQTNYDKDEWIWVKKRFKEYFNIDLDQIRTEKLSDVIEQYFKLKRKFFNLVIADAQKEFAELSQTGFGQDGEIEDEKTDFTNIRGTYEANPFVMDINQKIADLDNKVKKLKIKFTN